MRKRSLETFTESQKRNSEEITPKKTRNNDNDTISYLTAKYESESNLRKEELALRRERNRKQQRLLSNSKINF